MGGSSGGGKKMGRAAMQGVIEQRRQYEDSKRLFAPYINAGAQAVEAYAPGIDAAPETPDVAGFDLNLEQLKETPGYQFSLDQGQRQLDRMAGVNKKLTSGNRLTAALEYGQGLGTQLYNQEYDRGFNKLISQYSLDSSRYNTRQNMLSNLMGLGQSSVAGQAAVGQQTADNVSNLLQNSAQAATAGQSGGSGGVVGGAVAGASIGSVAGPYGAAVGGLVGGIVGLL